MPPKYFFQSKSECALPSASQQDLIYCFSQFFALCDQLTAKGQVRAHYIALGAVECLVRVPVHHGGLFHRITSAALISSAVSLLSGSLRVRRIGCRTEATRWN